MIGQLFAGMGAFAGGCVLLRQGWLWGYERGELEGRLPADARGLPPARGGWRVQLPGQLELFHGPTTGRALGLAAGERPGHRGLGEADEPSDEGLRHPGVVDGLKDHPVAQLPGQLELFLGVPDR